MSGHARDGFTIIEVILFLGVTGLLMLGVFVGVWGSITQQRYKDAVMSFQEALRQTYGDVVATQNNRQATASGDCVGNTGTSTCIMLGRYLHVSSQNTAGDGPSVITASDVIGTVPSSAAATGYINILRSYQPRVINNTNRKTSQMQWQTQLRWPNGDRSNGFSMLVIRSPETGQLHTFIWRGNVVTPNTTNLTSVGIVAANETNMANRTVCVDTNGMSVPPMGVRIQPRASTAAAVGQIANDAEGGVC